MSVTSFKIEYCPTTHTLKYSKKGSTLILTIYPAHKISEDAGVYFYVAGNSVYVGKSRAADGRITSHKSRPRWKQVTKCGLFTCIDFDQDERAAAERKLVNLLEE